MASATDGTQGINGRRPHEGESPRRPPLNLMTIGGLMLTIIGALYAVLNQKQSAPLQGRGTLPPANTPPLPHPGGVKLPTSPTAQLSSAPLKGLQTPAPSSMEKSVSGVSTQPQSSASQISAGNSRLEADKTTLNTALSSSTLNNTQIPTQLPDAPSILVVSAQPWTPKEMPVVDFEIKPFPLDLSEGMYPSAQAVLEAVREQLKARIPSSKTYSLKTANGREIRFGVVCAPQAKIVWPGFSVAGVACDDKTSRFVIGVRGTKIIFDQSPHPLAPPLLETLEKMGAYYCGACTSLRGRAAGILDCLNGVVIIAHPNGG